MRKIVVMISGKQGSGKTTLSDYLYDWARGNPYHVEMPFTLPVRMKFADVLYKMHDAVGRIAEEYGIPFNKKEGGLLQYLGTDLFRAKDPNVWASAVRKRVIESDDNFIIIDDMRFKNEFSILDDLEKNGEIDLIKIRLVASRDTRKERADGWRNNDSHPSETDLDDMEDAFDLVIDTSITNKVYTQFLAVSAIQGLYSEVSGT